MGMLSKVMIDQKVIDIFALVLGVIPCIFYVVIFGAVTSRMAFFLGDATLKLNGGHSFRPLEQVEPVGLLVFMTCGMGWGRWLPIKHQNFRRPVRDLLLCYFVGMVVVFSVAVLFLGVASFFYEFHEESVVATYVLWFFLYGSVLGVGFSVFQVLPLPLFCGFRVIFLSISQSMQEKVRKYLNVSTLMMIIFFWTGILNGFFRDLVGGFLEPLCQVVGVPFSVVAFYFL